LLGTPVLFVGDPGTICWGPRYYLLGTPVVRCRAPYGPRVTNFWRICGNFWRETGLSGVMALVGHPGIFCWAPRYASGGARARRKPLLKTPVPVYLRVGSASVRGASSENSILPRRWVNTGGQEDAQVPPRVPGARGGGRVRPRGVALPLPTASRRLSTGLRPIWWPSTVPAAGV
jgi:hypothetical protein